VKCVKAGFTLAALILHIMNMKYWRHTFWVPFTGTVLCVMLIHSNFIALSSACMTDFGNRNKKY